MEKLSQGFLEEYNHDQVHYKVMGNWNSFPANETAPNRIF